MPTGIRGPLHLAPCSRPLYAKGGDFLRAGFDFPRKRAPYAAGCLQTARHERPTMDPAGRSPFPLGHAHAEKGTGCVRPSVGCCARSAQSLDEAIAKHLKSGYFRQEWVAEMEQMMFTHGCLRLAGGRAFSAIACGGSSPPAASSRPSARWPPSQLTIQVSPSALQPSLNSASNTSGIFEFR